MYLCLFVVVVVVVVVSTATATATATIMRMISADGLGVVYSVRFAKKEGYHMD